MPRFFFNLYDGQDIHDEEGTDLGSVKEMRFYMLTMATEMLLTEHLRRDIWQMEVLDQSGRIVASLNFGVDPGKG